MRKKISLRHFIWLAVCVLGNAFAQDLSTSLAIETIAERRVVNTTTLHYEYFPATQIKLGDEIFYTVRVRNTTDSPLRDVVVTKEMPRNILYVSDSAIGPAAVVNFSVDGGLHYDVAENLTVSDLAGVRAAQPRDFTHVRWQLRHALAPGATALLRFRGTFH